MGLPMSMDQCPDVLTWGSPCQWTKSSIFSDHWHADPHVNGPMSRRTDKGIPMSMDQKFNIFKPLTWSSPCQWTNGAIMLTVHTIHMEPLCLLYILFIWKCAIMLTVRTIHMEPLCLLNILFIWHNGPLHIELAPWGIFSAGSEHANCLHRTMHICYVKVCHLQARTL